MFGNCFDGISVEMKMSRHFLLGVNYGNSFWLLIQRLCFQFGEMITLNLLTVPSVHIHIGGIKSVVYKSAIFLIRLNFYNII